MKTPTPVIRAYIRRLDREEISLEDIRDERTRADIESYLVQEMQEISVQPRTAPAQSL